MKRKNLYITSFLALTLGVTSCSKDFLELEPKTGQVEDNFYKTETQAKTSVFAIYDSYTNMYSADVVGISEAFSDDAFAGGQRPGDFLQYEGSENTDFSPENTDVKGLWQRCYEGIYRSNLYLSKEELVPFTTSELKDRLHAETLFLRGYMYWDLVRHYGWVPIINSVLPSVDDYKAVPQNTPAQVYQQIASDLLAALPNLPETVSSLETGRITKGACEALIARIYLYHTGISQISGLGLTAETWGNGTTVIDKAYVSTLLNDIIEVGKHYKLLPVYADVFSWDIQYNSESVLVKQYSNLAAAGWDNIPLAHGNVFTQRCGVRDPDPSTVVSGGWSGDVVSWDLEKAFGLDARKSATIFNAATELTKYSSYYMNTGLFNKKFMPLTAYASKIGTAELNWARNSFDIRYSDVLLMASELDVNGKKVEYFNLVHQRAGNPAVGSVSQDDILLERRLEFGGEGLRKWDLLRTGLAYAQAKCEGSFADLSQVTKPSDFAGRVFHADSWGMMPIPSVEIRNCNAGVLKQMVPYYLNK